jgi:hypothetical protein
MAKSCATIRRSTIQILRLLASVDEQRAYQGNVPFVSVPTELLCMWQDHYVTDSDEYCSAFSDIEQADLRAVDQAIKAACQDIMAVHCIEEFIESEHGRSIAAAARDSLLRLEGDR